MSHRVTCSHCDTALHILDWAATASVTCPRCMGRIPNPAFPEDAAEPPRSRSLSAAVITDDDVRRDSTRSGCGVAVLLVLAVIGVGSTPLVGLGIAGVAAGSNQTALAVVLAFTVFGLAAVGAVLAVAHRRQDVRQADQRR